MNKNLKNGIFLTFVIIVGLYFLILSLIKAKVFLIPLSFAFLLILIISPINQKLLQWKIPKILSVLISETIILLVFAGMFYIAGLQVFDIIKKQEHYQKNLAPKIEKIHHIIEEKSGISKSQQMAFLEKQNISDSMISKKEWIMKPVTFLANFLLIFAYIFFFLYYKDKFKKAILNFVPNKNRDNAAEVLSKMSLVGQQYLFGRFLLILFLAIIYSLGLGIIGIKHFLFVSVISALLSLIPYFGNIIGFLMATSMSIITSGSLNEFLGILLVFTIAQLIENYVLEPYVVGHKVSINPAITILGVVVGGLIWGLAGTIIAIPFIGILKVIFDNVPELNPLSYILDEQDIHSKDNWFNKIFN